MIVPACAFITFENDDAKEVALNISEDFAEAKN